MPSDANKPDPAQAKTGLTPLGIIASAIGIMLLIAFIGALAVPYILRSYLDAARVKDISHARGLGFALYEFAEDYGRFPDAQTAAEVAERTGSTLAPPGSSANDHLRQLIAAGLVHHEPLFYTRTAFTQKPDKRFDTRETALAPGELGFGYILNGETGFNNESSPALPLLCSPLAFDGKTVSTTHFDPDIYDGRVILLKIDLSAISLRANPTTGELQLDGKPWLDTGEDTIWGTTITPQVATPEPR